ncbi:MAG: type II toxin-antitoxin system VapC family toxin [Leptolyngbyaceae cyanobacterium RM2_2_4]|nr:type II toxin-antitoxin system VapC family toxin [Leptolyngbyaceae cyanobacterium RM2_2_4]
MVDYLLDTNVLLRMSDRTSPMNLIAGKAAATLLVQNHQLFITSQNIIEFWVVATRPVDVNGLGWSVEQTRAEIEQILSQFPQLEETPQIFSLWLNLVTTYQIKGKRVHDARLVAVMQAHAITHLLTFNPGDFSNIDNITIVHPQSVLEATQD